MKKSLALPPRKKQQQQQQSPTILHADGVGSAKRRTFSSASEESDSSSSETEASPPQTRIDKNSSEQRQQKNTNKKHDDSSKSLVSTKKQHSASSHSSLSDDDEDDENIVSTASVADTPSSVRSVTEIPEELAGFIVNEASDLEDDDNSTDASTSTLTTISSEEETKDSNTTTEDECSDDDDSATVARKRRSRSGKKIHTVDRSSNDGEIVTTDCNNQSDLSICNIVEGKRRRKPVKRFRNPSYEKLLFRDVDEEDMKIIMDDDDPYYHERFIDNGLVDEDDDDEEAERLGFVDRSVYESEEEEAETEEDDDVRNRGNVTLTASNNNKHHSSTLAHNDCSSSSRDNSSPSKNSDKATTPPNTTSQQQEGGKSSSPSDSLCKPSKKKTLKSTSSCYSLDPAFTNNTAKKKSATHIAKSPAAIGHISLQQSNNGPSFKASSSPTTTILPLTTKNATKAQSSPLTEKKKTPTTPRSITSLLVKRNKMGSDESSSPIKKPRCDKVEDGADMVVPHGNPSCLVLKTTTAERSNNGHEHDHIAKSPITSHAHALSATVAATPYSSKQRSPRSKKHTSPTTYRHRVSSIKMQVVGAQSFIEQVPVSELAYPCDDAYSVDGNAIVSSLPDAHHDHRCHATMYNIHEHRHYETTAIPPQDTYPPEYNQEWTLDTNKELSF